MKLSFALVLVLAVAASAQYTFCQRYTAALFGSSTAANQGTLLNAVVVRAAAGYSAWNAYANVTGLFNEPLNKGYFDGTLAPKVDFIKDAEQQANLVDHLVKFFGGALGCVEFAAANPWKAVDLKVLHANMNINGATMIAFDTQLALTLFSYGVPKTQGENTDYAYATALLGPFGLGGKMEICSDSTCPMWTDFQSFMVDSSSWWMAGSTDKTSTITVVKGGYVHWDLMMSDNVVETDSATGTTRKTGGKYSGMVNTTMTYTTKFDTVGTYYFYSEKAPSTKRATVIVALSGAASTTVSAFVLAAAAAFAFASQRRA